MKILNEIFKKIRLSLLNGYGFFRQHPLSIIYFFLFIASLCFLIIGIITIRNNQTIGIKYFGIAFSGFVAFGTILLALSTFDASSDKKRQLYDRFKKEHLDDIRDNCLRPILGRINDKYYNYPGFVIRNDQVLDEVLLQQMFNNPITPCDRETIFDSKYNEIVNNNLYHDLKNHEITKDIPGDSGDFKNILGLIKKNCPIYLENLIELIKRIKLSDEFEELENRLKSNPKHQITFDNIKNNCVKLIVAITLDYTDLKEFSTAYGWAYYNKELENIEKIGAIFKNSNEVDLIKTIDLIKTAKDEVKEKVDKLNEKINGILDDKTLMLDDECDYLKKIHAQIYQ